MFAATVKNGKKKATHLFRAINQKKCFFLNFSSYKITSILEKFYFLFLDIHRIRNACNQDPGNSLDTSSFCIQSM